MLVLKSGEVDDVDGVEDDADQEDAEEGQGQRDTAEHPRKHCEATEISKLFHLQ